MVFYDSADIYTSILSPFKEDILKINTTLRTNPEKAEKILEKAKGHIQEFLECGLSDIDNPSNMSTYSNDGYFFRHKSLSKVLLASGIMIDTRCILALAGALYSLFVISNLYILSRFSDAILMYFPIFFINSSHPINEQ